MKHQPASMGTEWERTGLFDGEAWASGGRAMGTEWTRPGHRMSTEWLTGARFLFPPTTTKTAHSVPILPSLAAHCGAILLPGNGPFCIQETGHSGARTAPPVGHSASILIPSGIQNGRRLGHGWTRLARFMTQTDHILVSFLFSFWPTGEQVLGFGYASESPNSNGR